MGIKSTMKGGLSASYEMIKLSSQLIPEIKKITKKMGEVRIAEGLATEDSMRILAKDIYNKLNPRLKAQITFEQFLPHVMDNRKKLMKKQRNKDKVAKKLGKVRQIA